MTPPPALAAVAYAQPTQAKGLHGMPTFMHRAARHLTGRLGTHGYGLVLVAAIWTLVAIGTLTSNTPTPPVLLHQHIPVIIDATLWLTSAMGCLAAALDNDGPRRDGLALAFATVPPMIRFVSYLWGWIVYMLPGGADDGAAPRGWYTAAFYACMVGLVWLVAAIRDDKYGSSDGL